MKTNTVQDLFSKTKQEWLEGARDKARELLLTKPCVTIEDVLEVYPRPNYLHRNITGSVFKDSDFQPIGHKASHRSVSHGRYIRTWVLRDPEPLEYGDSY